LSDESYPEDLRYHREHDWAKVEGGRSTFGITWYAQDALGEVVFFDPPEVGTQVTKDQPYADIDSTKASSEIYAPLTGEVTEVNGSIEESPEVVNEDPYGKGWLVKVKLSDPSEVDDLLDAGAYKKLLEETAD
jgi:glycine cleavage system H protein